MSGVGPITKHARTSMEADANFMSFGLLRVQQHYR